MKLLYYCLLFFSIVGCTKKAGSSATNEELSDNQQVAKSKPNIIFIYTDDQRRDGLGTFGNNVIITPEIDKLSEGGIKFDHANVVFALCSPSRAALLTGRYGSVNGILGLGSKLNDGETIVAKYLKDAGYKTAVSGKWHIGQHPKDLGFDFYTFFEANGAYYNRKIDDMGKEVQPSIHCDEYCVNRSIDFLKEAKEEGKPFFLFHNTQLPHMNGNLVWQAKQETLDKYDQSLMPVAESRNDNLETKPEYLKKVRNRTQAKKYGYPDKDAIQKHTKEYYSVITEMDNALGRLFKEIKDLGMMENTYIFFMSDNGWMLGEHGFTSKVLPYKPATEVPFFVLGPDIQPNKMDEIVLNIDMAPTMLELAGLNVPDNMHGKSLLPILRGEKVNWRKAFVYEGLGDYGGTKPNLTVISDKYRYIETYDDETLVKVIFQELYDQGKDAIEMNNLAGNKDYADQINEFKALIENHKNTVLNEK